MSRELFEIIIGWYDILAASIYCCTGKRTIETWIKEKGLRVSRVRGKRLIKKEWLDQFLEDHEVREDGRKVDELVDEVLKGLT